jgi:hypothetical protein
MVRSKHLIGLLAAVAPVACAESPPSGRWSSLAPQEDIACRQYDSQQIGSGSPAQATSQVFAETLQQRYDTNSVQCMYSRGTA